MLQNRLMLGNGLATSEGALWRLQGRLWPPKCHFVIPITSVSREHAQILRVNGKFFIEDLQSRNGTKVNNQTIAARTQLKDKDKIQICDFLASFQEAINRLPLPEELARAAEEQEPDDD